MSWKHKICGISRIAAAGPERRVLLGRIPKERKVNNNSGYLKIAKHLTGSGVIIKGDIAIAEVRFDGSSESVFIPV
jgi:hypothetical protein